MTTDVTPTDTKVHEVGTARTRRVEHFTPAERAARGKAARAEIPRSAHAAWEPTAQRRSPVDLLEEQAQTRVPELVPIRYGRMLVSPFTFYRGGAYLMAADLAGMPRTGLHVQLCGDAHLSNFGMFAAPDRRLVFSINDFDETLPGPFEWDVKRLVASFEIAGRDRGFDEADRQAINRLVVQAYREWMRKFAAMPNLDLWYVRLDVEEVAEQFRAQATKKDRKAVRAQRCQDPYEGQSQGLHQAHRDRRRRASHQERSADRRADRRAHRPRTSSRAGMSTCSA